MAYVTLRVLHGADRGKVFERLATPVTIGREEGNTIQLNDERISRYHLKFQEDNDKVVLTDLESTNGTKVNGVRVSEKRLDPGDKLTVARHHFEITYEPSKNGAVAAPADSVPVNLWGKSLLESAGLESRRSAPTFSSAPGPAGRRPDPPAAGKRARRSAGTPAKAAPPMPPPAPAPAPPARRPRASHACTSNPEATSA